MITIRDGITHTFSHVRQLREELIKLLLTLVELATTGVVDTKESHNAVNNKEAILIADEILCDLIEELHLVLRVHSTSIGDVVLSWKASAKQSQQRSAYLPVSGSTPKRSAI